MNAALYILCGGRSSRFGSDKGLFRWQGKPLVLTVAEQFPVLLSERRVVLVSGGDREYRELDLPLVEDLRAGRQGPLAGIEAAAGHAAGKFPVLFVTSCDRFGLREAWLEELAGTLERTGALAAAFFRDYWQPFPSAFRPEAGAWATRLLERGERRPAVLFDRLAIRVSAPSGWDQVRDVNRPGHLDEIS